MFEHVTGYKSLSIVTSLPLFDQELVKMIRELIIKINNIPSLQLMYAVLGEKAYRQ